MAIPKPSPTPVSAAQPGRLARTRYASSRVRLELHCQFGRGRMPHSSSTRPRMFCGARVPSYGAKLPS